METNILRQIFFDKNKHWDRFTLKHGDRIRPVVIKEVEKFRNCGNPKSGFKLLVCEACHDIKRVPYRCKGRFCTTCSSGETEEWGRLIEEDIYQTNHRHVVLTIDEGLWPIFLKHRNLLKEFMNEAVRIVQEWFEKRIKVTPGIIAGIHTFGAKMNFNPHVHMLVSMGGMKDNGEWKNYDYIPFEMLRKQWQTVVLKLIRKNLTEKEKKKVQPILQKAYKANDSGFYIYAPKHKGNLKGLIAYIGRYMRRPAIAVKRIKDYDGKNVTYLYFDKTAGEEKTETIPVEEFISRLIRHIPDKQFKTIRHYGVYSRRIKKLSKRLVSTWQKEARKWIMKAKRVIKRRPWRQRLKEQTGIDPMICKRCGNYYEYKGEVCLKDGELTIKLAVSETARKCLERMIYHITGIKTPKGEKEKKEKQKHKPNRNIKPRQYGDPRQIRLFVV